MTNVPEAPRVFLDTTYHAPTGITLRPKTSTDLKSALISASPGDTIELEPGATYEGNFVLPPKPDNGEIVIRTAQELRSARISELASLPRLLTRNFTSVLTTAPSARGYRLIGIELTSDTDITNLVNLTGSDLILDRVYVHGAPTKRCRRGIALNSASTAVIDSHISDCHEIGADSQAICGWNGPGPFKIVNCHLEGAGENVLFGGADPSVVGLIPSDIEFRRNHLFKPASWRIGDPSYAGIPWSIKNLLEFKNAQRALIDGNIFDGCWRDAQTGFAILFKSVNQDGKAPWCVTRDIDFTNNIVRNAGGGLNIQGRAYDQPGGHTERIRIFNNLFFNITTDRGDGRFLQITETDDVEISRNTVDQQGTLISTYGPPSQRFDFTGNIGRHNEYGVKGDGQGTGLPTLNVYFPGYCFRYNVIPVGPASAYPFDNNLVTTWEELSFTSDYRRLLSVIGCDIDALNAAMAGPVTVPPIPHSKARLNEIIAELQAFAEGMLDS